MCWQYSVLDFNIDRIWNTVLEENDKKSSEIILLIRNQSYAILLRSFNPHLTLSNLSHELWSTAALYWYWWYWYWCYWLPKSIGVFLDRQEISNRLENTFYLTPSFFFLLSLWFTTISVLFYSLSMSPLLSHTVLYCTITLHLLQHTILLFNYHLTSQPFFYYLSTARNGDGASEGKGGSSEC